jgi:hypothetical protein
MGADPDRIWSTSSLPVCRCTFGISVNVIFHSSRLSPLPRSPGLTNKRAGRVSTLFKLRLYTHLCVPRRMTRRKPAPCRFCGHTKMVYRMDSSNHGGRPRPHLRYIQSKPPGWSFFNRRFAGVCQPCGDAPELLVGMTWRAPRYYQRLSWVADICSAPTCRPAPWRTPPASRRGVRRLSGQRATTSWGHSLGLETMTPAR